MARILGDGRRKRTRVFSVLVSHYLFEDRFGRPGKGNDKGKVRGAGWICASELPGACAVVSELRCPQRLPRGAVSGTYGETAAWTHRDDRPADGA